MSKPASPSAARILVLSTDPERARDLTNMLEPLRAAVMTVGPGQPMGDVCVPALLLVDGATKTARALAEIVGETRRVWPRVPLLIVQAPPDSGPWDPSDLVDTIDEPPVARRLQARAALALELWEQRRALEMAMELGRGKDLFVRKVGHELRNPLNAMVGWSHLIQGGGLRGQDFERAAQTIARNARSLGALVTDLFDASRVVCGSIELASGPVDLGQIAAAACDAVLEDARNANVTLHCDLSGSAASVSADSERLRRAVASVLSYAIDLTSRGGDVSLRVERSPAYAKLWICGGQDRPRAQSSSVKLLLASYVLEAHGGALEVDVERCSFELRLPIAPAAGTSEREIADAPILSGVHALLVEDDPDGCEILEQVLLGLGATVTTAGNVREALAALHTQPPDVLISDIGLPDEDGFALIKRVRETTAFAGLPAVALTAYASKRDVAQALAAGFQAHIAKPVEPRELGEAVARISGR